MRYRPLHMGHPGDGPPFGFGGWLSIGDGESKKKKYAVGGQWLGGLVPRDGQIHQIQTVALYQELEFSLGGEMVNKATFYSILLVHVFQSV